MLGRVLEFSGALRAAGIPVAASENIDALKSLTFVPYENRELVKSALAAAMIKSEAHRPAFDTLFDLYFGTGRGPEARRHRDRPEEPTGRVEIIAELEEALIAGDMSALSGLARRAVAEFGRLENSPSKDWFSNYQVIRALDLDGLLRRLWDDVGAQTPAVERVVARDEIDARLERFRAMTLAETRRRVAEYRGPEAVADYAVDPLPQDSDFFGITTDLSALRKAVRPLARKLATRVAMKRRRGSRGLLDVRKTVRHSLSYGGTPFDTYFRKKAPHRPELFVLCDVSGSVGRFARFTLMLTHALSAQFSRVRSFAFVDRLDEVTRHFDHEDFATAARRLNEEADLVWLDGHSDYGNSFEQFWNNFGNEVGPKTTLLILGDARNNYRPAKPVVLKEIRGRARHAYWLNPEPRRDWDTGDSVASDYAACVDRMVEVRNLRQLEEFIENIL